MWDVSLLPFLQLVAASTVGSGVPKVANHTRSKAGARLSERNEDDRFTQSYNGVLFRVDQEVPVVPVVPQVANHDTRRAGASLSDRKRG
jgi:hypothetical protein